MKKYISLALFLLLAGGTNLLAQPQEQKVPGGLVGLSVKPGGLLIQHISLGEEYDLYEQSGIKLSIHNQDDRPHIFQLSTHKPSTVADGKWIKGYLEIPDPSWYWFEKGQIRIEANSIKEAKMYLRIPAEERYYNQHWVAALGVKGLSEPGQMIALSAYPKVYIETEVKEDVLERSSGLIGLEPSTVSLKEVALGMRKRAKVRISNNDNKVHRYKIMSMVFPADPRKRQITISPGCEWIPQTGWIRPKERWVRVDPGEAKEIYFAVQISKEKAHYNKMYEGILFFEPQGGLAGFVRVQIQTEKFEPEQGEK